jgi:hypothetical protein
MKVEIPSKFKYRTKDNAIVLATKGPDKKKLKLVYVDEKLFLEIPFQIDMRSSIERDLDYIMNIDLNENPLPTRSLDIRPMNTSNVILEKLKYLPGQEGENSRGRKALLKYHKKREEKEAIDQSGTNYGKGKQKSLFDMSSDSGANADSESDDQVFFIQGPSDVTKKISRSIDSSEKTTSRSNISSTKKVNRIINSLKERDIEDLEKIKYNSLITLAKERIDYSSIMPNSIVQSISMMSDVLAFGTRTKYLLGHPTNPGKRLSRVRRHEVYSKVKKGSEIDVGIAEKNYEKAEIDAFTDAQRKKFEEADKIISEAKDNVEGAESKGVNSDKVLAEIEKLKDKSKINEFISDVKSIKQLDNNTNSKPKKIEYIKELSNENSLTGNNKLSVLSSVKSKNSKESSVNRNRVASLSVDNSDSTEEKNLQKMGKSKKRKGKSSKSLKYTGSGARNAKKSVKSLMKRKIDPAKLLQSNRPTHYTLKDIKTPSIIDTKRRSKTSFKKEVKSLLSDPVNSHGRQNLLSDKTEDRISLISNVLVELPYELVESEETEDFDLIDQTEFDEKKNNFPIVYAKNIINRRRFLKHVIEVKKDQVFNNKLYCTIVTKDKKTRTKINNQRFIINLEKLRKQFLYPEPDQVPVMKVSNPNKEGEYTVTVENKHVIPVIIELFEKKSISGRNILDNKFKSILKKELKPDEVFKKDMIASRSSTSQFRLKFTTRLDNQFVDVGNIITADTDYEQKNSNEVNVSLFAYQKNEKGVYVVAKTLPMGTSAIKFFRKELNIDGGNTAQKNSNFKELEYATGEKVGYMTVTNTDLGVRILDRTVKDDRMYQYRVDILNSSGVKIENSSIDNCNFVFSKNLVDANLRHVSGSSKLGTYNFVLEMKQEKTNIENIIEKFQNEKFELFKEKIDNLTKTLLQEPTADIFLLNTTTGLEIKIGEYDNNSLVSITTKKKFDYIIIVKPKAFNPEMVISELNRLSKFVDDLQIDNNSTASKRKQAIDALKKKQNREMISFRPEKFYSRKAKKGIIEDEQNSAVNFNFEVQLGNYTGDNFAKKIKNRKKHKFGAKPGKIQVLANNFVYSSFAVVGDIKNVDFYFISMKKEGKQFPLTTVIGSESAKLLSFMDFNNADYQGRVDYYVQAVFRNGSISNPNYIGTCAILDKQYL